MFSKIAQQFFTDLGALRGLAPKGEAEDRRKPGCSVGEGIPPFNVY
jgi:hypothetical protein